MMFLNHVVLFIWTSKSVEKDYEMRGVKIKSVHSVKDLGVTVMSNLKSSQRRNLSNLNEFVFICNESVKKANRMMGLN